MLKTPLKLLSDFLGTLKLKELPETEGTTVVLDIYRCPPFVDERLVCKIARYSIIETDLNTYRIYKEALCVGFYFEDPTVRMEVYMLKDGSIHIQLYESHHPLNEDGFLPAYTSVHITWNGVRIDSFKNLDRNIRKANTA